MAQCFQMSFSEEASESSFIWERVKQLQLCNTTSKCNCYKSLFWQKIYLMNKSAINDKKKCIFDNFVISVLEGWAYTRDGTCTIASFLRKTWPPSYAPHYSKLTLRSMWETCVTWWESGDIPRTKFQKWSSSNCDSFLQY